MWIAACYDSGVESIPDDYRRWLYEDTALCRGTKRDMLHDEKLIYQTTTQSYRFLGPVTLILRKYWRSFYNQRQEIIVNHALMRLVTSSDLDASPSTHVYIEPSDEQVLLSLLDTFTSNSIADYIRSSGLMDDLPFTLFPTSGHSS
jgi:hypothetical protein